MKKKQKVHSWSHQELADALMRIFRERSNRDMSLRSYAKLIAEADTMGNMVFIGINLLARISEQLDELIAKK